MTEFLTRADQWVGEHDTLVGAILLPPVYLAVQWVLRKMGVIPDE